MKHESFIPANQSIAELTVKVVILAVLLAALLAVANTYLALKIGLLTSASIPAAIISMAVLRLFRHSTILENNLVQTAASAGEAVAGGIVYTVPALIMLGYWHSFSYWENFFIALTGGVLGVLFSIPLRSVLVNEPALRFPEGMAIAQVLKISSSKVVSISQLFWGLAVGGLLEFAQTGLKLVASVWEHWFVVGRSLCGFGIGFSPALLGAGYIIGFPIAVSIGLGAVLGWIVGVPLVSFFSVLPPGASADAQVLMLWHAQNSYIGIGAMLFAGIWTFFTLMRPFYHSLHASLRAANSGPGTLLRTERDIPLRYVLLGIAMTLVGLAFLFAELFPLAVFAAVPMLGGSIVAASVLYVLVIGFVFCAITGYFSGMVGVSATPGSAIIIAGIVMASFLLLLVAQYCVTATLMPEALHAAAAIAIIIGAVITGAAAIANDNIQDLKVGHILGATPWKQQVMLLLGVVVAASVMPPVMQILFDVYGIGSVLPHPGMDPSASLAAPPAALMAAITQAVLHANLPWEMIFIGAGVISVTIVLNYLVLKPRALHLSILGLAIGMYLPLSTSTPLFIGGLMAKLAYHPDTMPRHRGILIACGLVAGAALMDVVLAIPFSLAHNPDILSLAGRSWHFMAIVFGLLSTWAIGLWFYRSVAGSGYE
jgi:putative OPT family oligopeptide transporter